MGHTTPAAPPQPPAPGTLRPRAASRARRALAALREGVVVVAAAVVVSLLVKTFLVQAFYIPSESMQDTLLTGDRVLVTQLTPGPFALHRGDVVVFADDDGWLGPPAPSSRGAVARAVVEALTFVGVLPQTSDQHLVKRIIGLPGDHVVCCDPQGRTTVNGAALDEEPYLAPGAAPSEQPFDVTVPPGRLWVEGDNRSNSEDSRLHQGLPGGGSVAQASVVGRALVRVWPLDRLGWLSDHEEVFATVPAP